MAKPNWIGLVYLWGALMTRNKLIGILLRFFSVVTVAALPVGVALAAGKNVANGSKISLEYSVTLMSGTVITGNVGKPPLEMEVGKNQIFAEVERQMIGMQVNGVKEVVLTPEQAFGPVVQQKFRKVKLDSLPAKSRQVGAELVATAPTGGEQTVIVSAVSADAAILNFNHPLAGQTVKVKVKIIAIK